MANTMSPLINGNLIIDHNGIGFGNGTFELSLKNSNQNIICFSFMFIKLPISPQIKFGIKTETEILIQFDLATFLYSIQTEIINPTISFDGIDACIRLLYQNQKLFLYVNDVKLQYEKEILYPSFSFFLNVATINSDSQTILATSFHSNRDLSDRFSIYFPKLINHFWTCEDKTVITQSDNFVAFTKFDQRHTIISDELFPLPGSDIIYYEITIHSFDPKSIFRIGLTNHEFDETESVNPNLFDSVPFFSYPDQNFILSDSDESSDLIIHEGSVIGFGIQKDCADDVIFFIIDGIEYNGHFRNEEEEEDQNAHQKKKKKFCCRKHFYAFVVSSSDLFQFSFNAGSKPFRYTDNLVSSYNLTMPSGWSIYSPYFPNKWIKGLPPDPHVLNMFCPPNFERRCENCIIYQDELKERGCYEVSLLELELGIIDGLPPFKKGEEAVSVGFAPLRYQTDIPLGFLPQSYAISSIDGNVFVESSNEVKTYPKQIKTGSRIMTQRNNDQLTFFVDGTEIAVDKCIKSGPHPAVGYQASPCFIVNLGQSPFYHLPSLGKYKIVNSTETLIDSTNEMATSNSPLTSTLNQNENNLQLNQKENNLQLNQNENNLQLNQNENNLQLNQNENNLQLNQNENNLQLNQNENNLQSNQNENNLQLNQNENNLQLNQNESNLQLDVSNENKTEDEEELDFGFESDIIFDHNIRLHADSTNEDLSTMTLFNNVVVTTDKHDLNQFGFEIGDTIESRDRRFRGTVAGVLNSRIYCYIEKYEGAFPLVETDPIDVMITYRVLNRRKKNLAYPIISSTQFVDVNISTRNYHHLYVTINGLAIFLGSTNSQKFVFRPIADFYNNDILIYLNDMPPNIFDRIPRSMPFPHNSDPSSNLDVTSSFYLKIDDVQEEEKKAKPTKEFKFLDVILYNPKDLTNEKKKKETLIEMVLDKHHLNYALVFGRRGQNYLAWNGKEVITVPNEAKIQFESFCTFGSRRSFKRQRRLLNGLAASGSSYPFSFNGFLGTKKISKLHTNQVYFNSTGGCYMPPILHYLTTTLNETTLYNYSMLDESKDLFEILKTEESLESLPFEAYAVSEDHHQVPVKLITEFPFVGGSLYHK